jgi:sodium transport system permease protein
MRDALVVWRKELVDALRDRRTLFAVLLSSVLLGPALIVALSSLVAMLEETAERREIVVQGIDAAPTLRNFLERQTYRVRAAPPDYEERLRRSTLTDPVLVVPADFEPALRRGDAPRLELVSDAANPRAQAGVARVERVLGAFGRERTVLALALRGVSAELLDPVRIDERDLASTQSRAAQLTAMLPFFVLMAVLYGALHAALDTTAGERERGSLEPLLANPARRWSLVVGKWAAVASVSMLVALLSSASFLPAQALLRSDTLQALFRYGPREALLFVAVLVPFAAALSAILMGVAIRSRSFKEAQASATVVLLAVSLAPMVSVLNPGAEARWQLWVPAFAQNLLMGRILRGEGLGWEGVLVPLGVCATLAALGIGYVAHTLRTAALK